MADQRIDKEIREVLFTLSDGRQLRGEVFLNLYEATHARPQRVGELLNDKDHFIPVRTGEETVLLNLSGIVSARLGLERETDDLTTLGERYAVRAMTSLGEELAAHVFVNMPASYTRVKDYLNQPLRFFSFFLPDEIVYLNRRYLLFVRD
jgi:hypothetical protein